MRDRRKGGWDRVLTVQWLGPLLLMLVAVGCGPRTGVERVPISGSVSYLGEPVEVGQIRFLPAKPTRAPVTVETIRDGVYTAAASGGVPVGEFRVEIRMYDADQYLNGPRAAGSPAPKQLLPDKYNQDSELKISIASGSGAIKKDFLLDK